MSVSWSYPHLKNLSLADFSNSKNRTIDILIGVEHYYRYIYGDVVRGKINQPTAAESFFWVGFNRLLHEISTTNNFSATHMLRVNSEICEHSNDDDKNMKEVLNYGNDTKLCMKKENDYIENFKETLKFDEKFHWKSRKSTR